MDNWDDLRLFLAVARAGSLSAAARRLRLSQPTLGRRMSALEARLGLTLFVRTGRGLELSDSGTSLVAEAEKMEAAAAEIEAQASGRTMALEGTVTVSLIESVAQGWIAEALAAFRRHYPGIVVDLLVELSVTDLLRRQADIALRMFRPTQTRLIARHVGKMAWGLFAAKSYVERAGAPATREALAGHPMVLPDEQLSRHMLPLLERIGHLAETAALRSNSPGTLLAATRAGHGIGLHSCLLAEAQPDLVRVLPEWTLAATDLWLVAHEDLRHTARLRVLFDYLGERILADRQRFLGRSSRSVA